MKTKMRWAGWIVAVWALSSVVGCVPLEGGGCQEDAVGATFTISADEVNSQYGGGPLSEVACVDACEAEVMTAYPDHDVTACELESGEVGETQTYYCEWVAVVSCSETPME